MTEIEMDIDMAKPGGLGGHVDDDIIDFDTDMLDQHDQHDQEPENRDVNTEAMDRDMQGGIDTANHEAYETNGYMSEDVDFDLHDVEETTHDLGRDVDETTVLQKQASENQAETSTGSTQEVVDHIEISNEADNQTQDVQDDHASAHEIDYEVEDHVEQQEPQKELQDQSAEEPHEGVSADRLEASDADAATGDAVDDTHHLEDVTEAHEQETQAEPADQARRQESIQNEDEKHEQETAPDDHEAAALGSAEDAAADNIEEADYEDGDQYDDEHSADHEETATHDAEAGHGDVEHVEDAEHITYDQTEVDVDEHPEGETVDLEHDDHSTTGDDSAAKPETEFPTITVQYKGDEFPLFSATSDGFFTDTSILDETLEKLLAGLRSELENEIAEDDELVFQVDELGLELAESTQGELMTNVTFRQIVEIFDLLVKNQDPDGSKTLYTYLFTKPNTEKRLESLIESAAAGKGLDEVIHLFESPMPVASLMETDNAVDGLHEELDGFDSPEDEGRLDEVETAEHDDENSGEADVDADIEVSTTHNNAEDEHNDGNDTTEPATEIPADAGTLDETVTETSHHPDAVAEDENSERNAPVDSEADPFADLELDVSAEDDDEEVDLEDDEVTEEHVVVESEVAHAGTNDTSTTATLKDEDEAGSINVDLSVDATEEGTVEKTGPNEENDLDEIDWRDEPEVDDEGPSTPSAAGKRARGDDDEADAEDEQVVKRRRP
ncbi:hypothetical protein CEP53_011347 [Fusarium sp. AF-6]|nr:hypothetical protein CEP53_011347 [Fusarium sp. AF-6]